MRKHADRAGRGALSHRFTGKLACRFPSRNAASSAPPRRPERAREEARGAPPEWSERARVEARGAPPEWSDHARVEARGAPPEWSEHARLGPPALARAALAAAIHG
jgi:hypothetical protein